jgi:hypothetical protein
MPSASFHLNSATDRLVLASLTFGTGGDAVSTMPRIIGPRQQLQRHKRKYTEGELGPDRSFYFRGPENSLNLRAQNLMVFLQIADGVDDVTWMYPL